MRIGGRSWKVACAAGIAVVLSVRGAAAQGSPLFQEVARLTPAGAAGLELGSATLSGDGNRALLGFRGVAFVFARTAGGWAEEARLDPPAGAPVRPLGALDQSFGSAVALSGDGSTALVGGEAPCTANPAAFCQAAWVFVRQGAAWSSQAALPVARPWGVTGSRRFVDLSADGATALVGAPCFGLPGGTCDAGLAYGRSGTAWSVQGALAVPTEVAVGGTVALSGDGALALLGGNDFAVRVFARTGGTWSAVQTLDPPTPSSPDRVFLDFGAVLDLNQDGGVALIGDPSQLCGGFELGSPCGSAVFSRRSGGLFTHVQLYEKGTGFEATGSSVALSADGSLALITQPGVAKTQVLLAAGGDWAEVQELGASEPPLNLLQGGFAALSGTGRTALVGNVVFEQASVVAIPTVSELGLMVLALLLAAGGAVLLARRRTA